MTRRLLKNTYDVHYRLCRGDDWRHYGVVDGAIEAMFAVNSLRRQDDGIVTRVSRRGLSQTAPQSKQLGERHA